MHFIFFNWDSEIVLVLVPLLNPVVVESFGEWKFLAVAFNNSFDGLWVEEVGWQMNSVLFLLKVQAWGKVENLSLRSVPDSVSDS